MPAWIWLGIAIIAEVIATTALKASDGFNRAVPSTIVIIGYGIAFYGLSMTLKEIPIGVAYAIWSGVGIVCIALIGLFVYGQRLDWPAIAGISLILAGVLVMNIFSKTVGH